MPTNMNSTQYTLRKDKIAFRTDASTSPHSKTIRPLTLNRRSRNIATKMSSQAQTRGENSISNMELEKSDLKQTSKRPYRSVKKPKKTTIDAGNMTLAKDATQQKQ